MGRFYKTASATPLDYMDRLNVPLMEKVIDTNDQYIDQSLNQTTQLTNLADTFPYLDVDQDRAKEITDQYNKKIDDITATIRSDPANWRSQSDSIQDVGKDLLNNYKTGEISKIASNYGKYKEVSDYIDKQNDEYTKTGKGISADRGAKYKQMFLSNFLRANPKGTSYDSKTGDYNSFEAYNPMSNIDIRKALSDQMDKLKADGEIRITDQLTGSGEYFNKETNKYESITPERILRIATDRLNDPQIMDYLRQDTQAGIINGVYDTNTRSPNYGRFINPYTYNGVPLSSADQTVIYGMRKHIDATKNTNLKQQYQQQLDAYTKQLSDRKQLNWNDNSYLSPILRGIVDQYSSSKIDTENSLRANPIWSTKFVQSQTNNRDAANIKSKEDMQEKLFTQQKALQDDKLKATNTLATLKANIKLGKGKVVAGMPTTPVADSNSIIGKHFTAPFYYLTNDKTKLTSSLNDEISTYDYNNTQLEKTVADMQKDSPDSKLLLTNAQNQLANNKARLASLQARREDAINYAIDKWKAKGDNAEIQYMSDMPSQEKDLRSYISGDSKKTYDNANTEFSKVDVVKKQMDVSSPDYKKFISTTYLPAKAAKDKAAAAYLGGQQIFNSEIKQYSDERLEKAARETTNNANVVSVTQPQSDQLVKMINGFPSNYKIIDDRGKETNLSFEHGTATTDPSKFKINGVSATTGLGEKQLDIMATINGKDVIITPNDGGTTNSYLSDEFRKSKDKDVNNIGRILSSPTAATISDMMTEMRMNNATPLNTKDAWVYRTIVNPSSPSSVIDIRMRNVSTGGDSHAKPKWELQFKTNNSKLIAASGMKNITSKLIQDQSKNKEHPMISVDGKTLTGYVPLSSSKSANGEYQNLEDILSIFPADQ